MRVATPSIAAVISFYRNAEHIQEAVASVLAQTHPPREIVVVDDASPGDTSAVLRGLPAAAKVVRHPTNTGVGGARQTGIDLTSSSLVAFLDGDDLWVPTKLEQMLAYWANHPEADALHTGTTVFRRDGSEQQFLDKPSPLTMPAQLRWNRILMQTALIPRTWLTRVGPFARTKAYVPDWDYGIRLVAAGARIECVPEPLTRVRRYDHDHISRGGWRQIRRRTATVRRHWTLAVATVGHREAHRILCSITREEAWKLPWPVGRPIVALAAVGEQFLGGGRR